MVKVTINKLEYEIDEWGNITKRIGKGFLKCRSDKDGYLRVTIKNGKSLLTELLHRIVFRAFHGEIPSGMTIDHIDNDKLNNHKDNLQLMTHEDNIVKGQAVHWIVTKPDGIELEIYNLSKFCRENNLNHAHIVNSSSKGWKARKRDG